ncbi:MAG: ABC transporter permease [Cellvibrionaceae bacterium]|nr:ABC transporter permease [Cellvibrionaceae bacterium]
MSDTIFFTALAQATSTLASGDPLLWDIILLSFRVSLSALVIALLIGIPLAWLLTVYHFPGKRLLIIVIDTLMALPPVVIGLVVYLLLSRNGPLGILGLLYTPTAMIMAQALLITPLVCALSLPFFTRHWQTLREQLLMLGIAPRQTLALLVAETKIPLITVALAAFGRAIAEIGAVMIVGGNIAHHTRVMTTAIAMETRQGNLALALSLGMILLLLALLITITAHALKWRDKNHGA